MQRQNAAHWGLEKDGVSDFSSEAKAVREALEKRGASFFHELVSTTKLLPSYVERGSPSWRAPVLRAPTASPACVPCSPRRRSDATWSKRPGAGLF